MKELVIKWAWSLEELETEDPEIVEFQAYETATILIDDEVVEVKKYVYSKKYESRFKREDKIIKKYCNEEVKLYDIVRN